MVLTVKPSRVLTHFQAGTLLYPSGCVYTITDMYRTLTKECTPALYPCVTRHTPLQEIACDPDDVETAIAGNFRRGNRGRNNCPPVTEPPFSMSIYLLTSKYLSVHDRCFGICPNGIIILSLPHRA